MTAIVELRKRLASTLRLRLGHAGVTISATVASDMAGQALRSARIDDLLTLAIAADGAATALAVVADGGAPPADLEARREGWSTAKEIALTDPVYADVLEAPA